MTPRSRRPLYTDTVSEGDRMPVYRQLIEDAAIPEDARTPMVLAATCCSNMTGSRLSDAVRSEIRDYQNLGHDQYLISTAEARSAIRGMGY